MPHYRLRHALENFKNASQFSPIIGIFGHRQSGKTTFLEHITQRYFTFDDFETLTSATQNPKAFLNQNKGHLTAIDESQLCPVLFPAVKEHVRTHKSPGQWILSGSVRFSSRQAIRESLTGRVIQIEMLPLVLTELAEEDRARLVLKLIPGTHFPISLEEHLPARLLSQRSKLISLYLENGGLPGVCFMRNDRFRQEHLTELTRLILDRDIRLVYPTSIPYSQLDALLRAISRSDGEILRTSTLRRETGISEITIKKLLFALEATFVLRQLPLEGDRSGVSYFFEDQAECKLLQRGVNNEQQDFEGVVYRNLRASFYYETGLGFSFYQYRRRPDVKIPFAIRTSEGILGFVPILGEQPTKKQIRATGKFLQDYGNAKIIFVTSKQPATLVLSPRMLQIPAERILFE